jgi:DNA-3-methyladenine glycosylase I
MSQIARCPWAGEDPVYVDYHDTEWGVPNCDERHLFEMLVLEGFQAGLSWLTILKKRNGFRRAFDNFDPEVLARYDRAKINALLNTPAIVRNRMKIEAAVCNARAVLAVREACGSFSDYVWKFVDGRPLRNAWTAVDQIPAYSACSQAMSGELKRMGFRFIGPTVCYAFMQAVGMVNDHIVGCFRYDQL